MDCKNMSELSINCTNNTSSSKNESFEWKAPEFNASFGNILIAILLGTIDIVTIFGNILVILSFVVERRLLRPFNMYILNLAVTDLLIAMTAMTFYTIDTLLRYWPFGVYLCWIWIYFDFALTFASVFTMVAISVDRYWCVTWPYHFKRYNSKRKIVIIVAFIWFCVIVIWTPPFIEDRLGHNEPYKCIWEPSENRDFVDIVSVIGYYIPCSIMLFCYIKVWLVMRRPTPNKGYTNSETPINVARRHNINLPDTQSEIIIPSQSMPNFARGRPISLATESPPVNRDCVSDHTNAIFTLEIGSTDTQQSASRTDFNIFRTASHQQRERRTFILLTYILCSYVVCWCPFYIVFHISAWQPDFISDELYSVFFWSTYVNSTLNPFIYAYSNREFRAAFKKVKKRFKVCSYTDTAVQNDHLNS